VAIVGVDAHKRSHTLVAIDRSGRKLAEKTSTTNSSGHLEAIRWARGKFGASVEWAVEDCRHVSRRLEQDLIDAGYSVIRVPTRLMARTRASARTAGKSDPIDALAVARAALREPDLPTARHHEALHRGRSPGSVPAMGRRAMGSHAPKPRSPSSKAGWQCRGVRAEKPV
jgi:transposase